MTRYTSLSYPEDFQPTLNKFKTIAKRDGKNASELLREMITTHVDIHDPGNPQARITSYVDDFHNAGSLAIVEGKIREIFLDRHRKKKPVKFLEIVAYCRDSVPVKQAIAMSNRIYTWLKEQGVQVWRT